MRGTCVQRLLAMTLTTSAVVASLGGLAAAPASASIGRSRVAAASTRHLPARARVAGRVSPSRRLALTIALQPRDPLALSSFATAVSTPGSPQYGQFLSVPQFARRYGATTVALAAVKRAMRAGGLRVGSVSANQLSVTVSGTAAHVERTFQTTIAQVRLANGRRAYANTTPATLSGAVAGDVQGVVGLDSATKDLSQLSRAPSRAAGGRRAAPRARAHSAQEVTGGPQPCNTIANQFPSGYTADQIATAYGVSPFYQAGNEGQGQTVALYEPGAPYPQSDVGAFLACYGITTNVTQVPVDGGPGAYSNQDDGEVTLDIDNVAALAPKANILVYDSGNQATNGIDTLTAIVSQNQAKIVSISYGQCEAQLTPSTVQAENTLLQEAAAQGQSVFSSSGDAGDATCSQHSTDKGLSVIDPGAQPFNTAVGGTTLSAIGPPPTEEVWNDGSSGGSNGRGGYDSSASGGGLSTEWAMPSYQSTASSNLGVINSQSIQNGVSCGSTYCREVPDVAADASGTTGYVVYSSHYGGWYVQGGTSASAPVWAALAALFDASPTCRGLPLGFVNPSLYAIAGSTYLSDFNDISANSPNGPAGNDVFGINNGVFPVTANYDMTTGLGSPVSSALGGALCSARAPVYTVAVASPGALTTAVGTAASLAIHASDSGNASLTYTATGLPAGLAINAATGVITGTPTTAQATTVTVSATDGFTNTGSVRFGWSIVNLPAAPPPATVSHSRVGKPYTRSVKISGLVKRRPKLSFVLDAGRRAPALKSLSIALPRGLSFANKTKSLDKGLTIKAGKKKLKFKVKVKRGVLTITLAKPERSIKVTVGRPAIAITRAEAAKIKHRKVRKLTFKIKATSVRHKTTTRSVTLTKLGH